MENIQLLKELLSESELEFFESLAPSYQKNFANHAFSAKREETRLKNQDEVKEAMELKCKNIFDYKKKKTPRPEQAEGLSDDQKLKIYYEKIADDAGRKVFVDLINHAVSLDDKLTLIYAWNQPMIKYNETFIIAFSSATKHFSVGLEAQALDLFSDKLVESGFELMKKGAKIQYNKEINIELLDEIIRYTIEIKKDAKGFWA